MSGDAHKTALTAHAKLVKVMAVSKPHYSYEIQCSTCRNYAIGTGKNVPGALSKAVDNADYLGFRSVKGSALCAHCSKGLNSAV